MSRYFVILICLAFFSEVLAFENDGRNPGLQNLDQQIRGSEVQDTAVMNQLLYNGKVWIGLYYGVHGTEFFIDNKWKRGDVTMNGRTFTGLEIKYDTYNDNLLVNYLGKRVLILNSEMVQGFSVETGEGVTHFTNMTGIYGMEGYYELLYDGDIKLYRKFKKRRAQFAVEARYDEFQPMNSMWLVRDGELYMVTNRRNLYNFLSGNDKNTIRVLKKGGKRPDVTSSSGIKALLEEYDRIHNEKKSYD